MNPYETPCFFDDAPSPPKDRPPMHTAEYGGLLFAFAVMVLLLVMGG